MSSFQPRQPTGTPSGGNIPYNSGQQNRRQIGAPGAGQFTFTTHNEGNVSLGAVKAPAITGPAFIRIPKQVFAAVRTMVGNTIRKVRGRSMEPKPYGRTSPFSTKAKLAVAGLVLVVGAGAGVTAVAAGGNSHPSGCQAAPASVAATATTASFTTSVPARGAGGGGHGGGGHSSGHSSSSGHSTSSGHAAETGGSHVTESGSHVSAPVHIPTVTPTSGVPLRDNYVPAASTNGGSLAPYMLMNRTRPMGHTQLAPTQGDQADQCAPAPAGSSNT